MNELIIIGAGGFGREVAWLVERINAELPRWKLVGFVDDDREKTGLTINGHTVLGTTDVLEEYGKCKLVCAVGFAQTRRKIVEKIKRRFPKAEFATLIDPDAIISDLNTVGDGCIICAGNILTVNITIGDHVIINLSSTVGHDAVISDYVTVYPGVNVSGFVTIGEATEIGTGTQILPGKNVGKESLIGAGAVVINDIPDRCTAVGCPAKPIKMHE